MEPTVTWTLFAKLSLQPTCSSPPQLVQIWWIQQSVDLYCLRLVFPYLYLSVSIPRGGVFWYLPFTRV